MTWKSFDLQSMLLFPIIDHCHFVKNVLICFITIFCSNACLVSPVSEVTSRGITSSEETRHGIAMYNKSIFVCLPFVFIEIYFMYCILKIKCDWPKSHMRSCAFLINFFILGGKIHLFIFILNIFILFFYVGLDLCKSLFIFLMGNEIYRIFLLLHI